MCVNKAGVCKVFYLNSCWWAVFYCASFMIYVFEFSGKGGGGVNMWVINIRACSHVLPALHGCATAGK